ncbi:MAG: hypothetical protein Q8L92_06810, partial [Rubrivivax sp.]|nr:hypothetical protein [Rubrivivax sp.]
SGRAVSSRAGTLPDAGKASMTAAQATPARFSTQRRSARSAQGRVGRRRALMAGRAAPPA